ncbi:IS110 family transposase [Patescibacteria group bacterium]|nr:IS110 family transposase [Patescibacteria group bacterium]
MNNENKKLDFSNQEFFIGIDVHKKSWKITIRCGKVVLKTYSMNPNPKELFDYMKRNYPGGEYNSVYEAGFSGYWAHRELEKYGFKNIIVAPTTIPTSGKEKLTKTDKIDSRKLARELENESISGIYIPNILQQEMRSLCRLRYQQIRKQTRIKNQIKSYLNFYGHELPKNYEMQHWSKRFIKCLEELKFEYAMGSDQLEIYIEELVLYRARLLRIIRDLRKYSIEYGLMEDIRLLMKIPGVGFITAITLYTELMEINRFPNVEKLASYVGLVPTIRSSGQKENVLGISVQCNRYLRCLLIESAWIAIRNDPALTLAYKNYLKRMSGQEAIVRIAKKLLNRIHYVWREKKEYVCSVLK